MSSSRISSKFTVFISAFVFFVILTHMLVLGQTLWVSASFALAIAFIAGGLSKISYSYKEFLQRRAFTGKKQAYEAQGNHQTRTVEIDLPLAQAFDLSMEALQTLDDQRLPVSDDVFVRLEMMIPRKQRLHIRNSDKASGVIQAGLRARTLYIPEYIDFSRIQIRLEAVDKYTTRVHIESRANTVFDTYDLGKNLHYVNTIALYLRRESQQLEAGLRLGDSATDDAYAYKDDSANQQSARS